MSKIKYVAGFLFSEDRSVVALVHKNRPAWQAGKLNAIGGKVEPGETALEAQVREFEEETGVCFTDWEELAVLEGPDFEVVFFVGFSNAVYHVRTVEDEVISLFPPFSLVGSSLLMPNLNVLLTLALDDSGIAKPVVLLDERKAA